MPDRISQTGTLTTVHLAILAVLAVLVILGILWGARLKRQRTIARETELERVEAEGGHAAVAGEALDAAPTAPPATPTAPPVTPTAPPVTPPVAKAPDPRPPVSPAPADLPPVAPPPVAPPPVAAAPPPLSDGLVPGTPPAAPASPADGPVTQLKGLGPKVATMLADRGIVTVGQIAALDAAQADALDAGLGAFAGRMARDRWIEQARLLAAGDVAGFEAVFGKL